MVATAELAVKVRTNRRAFWFNRSVRAVVCADWYDAVSRGDKAEAARCRQELDQLDAEIDELTNGRGW